MKTLSRESSLAVTSPPPPRAWGRRLLPLAVAAALTQPLDALAAQTAQTTRLSVASGGAQANGDSGAPARAAGGRYTAFASAATNLVAGDTNGMADIFVRDEQTGQTTRVSIATNGAQADNHSSSPSISADGRYIAFSSSASNLVADDTNGIDDVFVHDRQTKTTTRISVSTSGGQTDKWSSDPRISADGNAVAFVSDATNLVTDDLNDQKDVFVHDRRTKTTTRVSVATGGAETDGCYLHSDSSVMHKSYRCGALGQSLGLSSDGRYVAFASAASNLVSDDTNGNPDLFVHDRLSKTTTRVSVASGGGQINDGCYFYGGMDAYYNFWSTFTCNSFGDLSSDGRYVVFTSYSSDLNGANDNDSSDLFVHDRLKNTTTQINPEVPATDTTDISSDASISADGRFIAYSSSESLINQDTNTDRDIYVYDRIKKSTTLISSNAAGAVGGSSTPSISADGRFVAFASSASNLVAKDTNSKSDIFVRDLTITPNQSADVRVTLADVPDPVKLGQPLTYTATITNAGSISANLVNLTTWLSPMLQPSSVIPSQGSCAKAPITVCRLGSLAAGASATVKMTLNKAPTGTLTAFASVNAAPKDPTPSNNRAQQTTTINP